MYNVVCMIRSVLGFLETTARMNKNRAVRTETRSGKRSALGTQTETIVVRYLRSDPVDTGGCPSERNLYTIDSGKRSATAHANTRRK